MDEALARNPLLSFMEHGANVRLFHGQAVDDGLVLLGSTPPAVAQLDFAHRT